jgi:hypothetical protein
MNSAKTVIYIAGYGRSGSTLLERVLGDNRKVFALGELKSFFDTACKSGELCSCGKRVDSCEFWGPVLKVYDEKECVGSESIRSKAESLFGLFFNCSSMKHKYSQMTEDLFKRIFSGLPENTGFVIDSSKTTRNSFFRPIRLSKFVSLEVKVIHLVRDGRGCIWSNLKGSNRRMEKGENPRLPIPVLRTVINWPLANAGAELFRLFSSSENYCRVRYEDLVDDPAEILSQLGAFLGLDFSSQIDAVANKHITASGHQLSGNRMRLKKEIVVKKDMEWGKNLKLLYRFFFWMIDWAFALRYGYK